MNDHWKRVVHEILFDYLGEMHVNIIYLQINAGLLIYESITNRASKFMQRT